MRTLLIYPNIEQNSSLPQVGLSSLSACLKRAGHEVALLDYTYLDLARAEELLAERLADFKPGAVGISIRSFEWDFVKERLLPVLSRADLPVIVGGPHPTAVPDEVMVEESIQVLVRGEGEDVLVDLVDAIEKGRPLAAVEGCWVRSGGRVIKSDVRTLIADLDSLPMPDWDIWDRRHFLESHSRKFMDDSQHTIGALESSRGCPYACPYCISPTLHQLYKGKGKYHREKSVDRIIAEAIDRKEKYGIDYVNFIDETFLLRDKRVDEFCHKWKDQVGLPFRFTTRPETVKENRIRLVAEAGANLIGLGIESGDPEYRRSHLNRRYTQEQVYEAVEIIKRHGIQVFGFFVMGMPYETRENIEQTLKLIQGLNIDHYTVTLCYPFKGTPFYDVAVKEKMLVAESTGVPNVWEDTPLSLPGLPRRQLVRLRNLVSYFGSKDPKWRPLMSICEKNLPAYYAWKFYRKIERKLRPSDIL